MTSPMSDPDHFDDHVEVYERLAILLGLETDKPQAQVIFGKYRAFQLGATSLYITLREDTKRHIWHNDDGISPVDQEMLAALRRHMILDELASI